MRYEGVPKKVSRVLNGEKLCCIDCKSSCIYVDEHLVAHFYAIHVYIDNIIKH